MSIILKHFLKIVSISAFSIFLLIAGTCAYIFSFYGQENTDLFECGVVFGAAVWPGGNPSHALADRTYTALDVYKKGQIECLIFSGANSAYGKHEVDVMYDIAIEEGISKLDIELDYDGSNTKHTIENLDPSRSYLFISSDFHLARISLLARQAGLVNTGTVSSEYRLGRYTREQFFIFRELIAFWYYVVVR